jgi:hypothetical protein
VILFLASAVRNHQSLDLEYYLSQLTNWGMDEPSVNDRYNFTNSRAIGRFGPVTITSAE